MHGALRLGEGSGECFDRRRIAVFQRRNGSAGARTLNACRYILRAPSLLPAPSSPGAPGEAGGIAAQAQATRRDRLVAGDRLELRRVSRAVGLSGEISSARDESARTSSGVGSLPGSTKLMKIAQFARCCAVVRVHEPSGGATESGSGLLPAGLIGGGQSFAHEGDSVRIGCPPPGQDSTGQADDQQQMPPPGDRQPRPTPSTGRARVPGLARVSALTCPRASSPVVLSVVFRESPGCPSPTASE